MKRLLSLLLSALLLLSLAACGEKDPLPNASERDTDATETPAAATTLTVLSASPSLSGALEEIAAAVFQFCTHVVHPFQKKLPLHLRRRRAQNLPNGGKAQNFWRTYNS